MFRLVILHAITSNQIVMVASVCMTIHAKSFKGVKNDKTLQ